jgi:foldase protein PrsA
MGRLIAWGLVGMALSACMLGIYGCGGGSGGLPAGTAVVVDGRSVSEAAVAHWTPIEAVLAYELFPQKAVPPGLVPDPPNYTRCIAYLRQVEAERPVPKPIPPAPVLKQRCRARYEGTRTHMIDFLTTYHWLELEAAERGWGVSTAAARADLERHIRSQFGDRAAFARYLTYTGLNMEDEVLRFKNNLLASALLTHILPAKGTDGERLAAYKRFLDRWIHRTHCRPGYLAPNCSEYKGPLQPGA